MKINIIGGGTAGWWTAGYLRKNHPDIEITLIESPTIPIIGVGESTMPGVRAFFEELEIPEEDWIKACSGVIKKGTVKKNYNYEGDDPFTFIFVHSGFDEWYEQYKQGKVEKSSLYELYNPDGWRSYAYHIDSAQAWQIVKEYTKDIKHVFADVTRDTLPEADLNIDCTGLGRHIIQDKTLHRYRDTYVNTCIVRRVEEDFKPYTETIARNFGWEFNIYLSDNRVGVGYVFDSNLISIDDAKEEYMKNNGHRKFLSDFRLLQWEPGRLERPWQGDTVAVGLSAGFIEPLEANGLSLMVHQIRTLSRVLKKPNREKLYNKAVSKVFDQVTDFLWHHYACASRNDTAFWKRCSELDGETTLWKRIKDKKNLKQNLYPSYVYAFLAIYYNLKEPKDES